MKLFQVELKEPMKRGPTVRRLARLSSLCLTILLLSPAQAEPIRIVVHVPASTPAVEPVYVAGSLPIVGSWKPDGVKLTRESEDTYIGELDLKPGQKLEFKLTLGSWDTVEKNVDGTDRPNRTVVLDSDTRQIEVTVASWAATHKHEASTVVGELRVHKMDSRHLKAARTIRVWLPPSYDTDAKASYSTLYMQDGQNCFDRATSAFGTEWQIDETLTKLIKDNRIPPIIVVGVDNGLANRIKEYTYSADSERGGGYAAAYASYLLTEVKPFVDKSYRTKTDRAHTLIGGSSLGGLISLDIALRHPNTFAGVIAMSPALRWSGEAFTKELEQDPGGLLGTRVWIDMGTSESYSASSETTKVQNEKLIGAAKRLDAALTKHRIAHRLVIDDQHSTHNETAWANRFPEAIMYTVGE